MNRVLQLSVWYSHGAVTMSIHRRETVTNRTISDHKANCLARRMYLLALRQQVLVHPFVVPDCYGWSAERI